MADGVKPPLHNSSSPRDKEPKEIEKVLKWQQERIARKLRGEYESAVIHLSEVINGTINTPVSINAVRVEGAVNTRNSFLGSIIDPFISPQNSDPGRINTLEDVLHTTRRISSALRKTDIFTSIEAYVDRPRDPQAGAGGRELDLVFRTKERGRWYVSSSTELGNNEGSASASARIRNVFGGAETFEANMSMGTKTRRAFRGALTTPLTADMNTFGEVSAYGLEKDLSNYASCFEGLKGGRVAIKHGTPDSGAHELAYDAVIRHVAALTPTASISMREAAGTSTKSSISHTFTYDTRDDKITATRGIYGKLYQEIAGLALGGDATFYKVEAEGQVSRGVGKIGGSGLAVFSGPKSISLAARTGLLWGLGGDEGKPAKTLFSDRFQLGGPTSVRSFRANSMGPRDGADSVGGQLYYSAGASVISDVPYKPHWPLKAHLWVNAGRLDGVSQAAPLEETIINSLSRPSVSAGVGLIYRFDPIRVEVNFGVPLVASTSDGSKRGLQVGMGLEFL